jgi:heat shock protein HspQ
MEDDDGQPIHTYLAEAQLSSEPAMNIRNNRRWTNWREPFASSCRLQIA